MEEKRKLELLAYAKICFEKCTSPFASMHLIKKNVSSDECIDLSHLIAEMIDSSLFEEWDAHFLLLELEKAEKEFMETQE